MSGGLFTGVGSFFTQDDVQNIGKIDGVALATPLIQKSDVKLFSCNKTSTPLVMLAVNFSEFWEIYPDRLVFEWGSLPQTITNNTAVIGYNVQHLAENEAFAGAGQNITAQMTLKRAPLRIENFTFTLAGTLAKSGAAGFINFDDAIFIPIETVEKLYDVPDSDMIFVRLADPDYSDSVAKEIGDWFGGESGVRVLVPAAFLEQVESILNMLQIFLTAVASIALLVAGLGIMNIMTVSVMERTREIGILKAIGARSRTILTMFLTEAALIGILGGLTGIPLGYAVAQVMGRFLFRYSAGIMPRRSIITGTTTRPLSEVSPILSPEWIVIAIIFAVGVSVIFGWYPARKAAKLDPVKALRYE
jgi:ABC-type antimicrobial peptide transport system permease subunit